ncbi:MAG: hypothetical protein PHE73_08510 [Sulfurovaceae bacterium]|nr:hypothetical protein [Sulfurovaceae bacterium]
MYKIIIIMAAILFTGCATPSFNTTNTAYLVNDFLYQTKNSYPVSSSNIYIKPDSAYKKQLSDALRKAGYKIESSSSSANVIIDIKIGRIEKDVYNLSYIVNDQMLSRAYMINKSSAPITNWSKTMGGVK